VHGKAEVLRCLIAYHDHLTNECATETSRAARLALWDYQVQFDCASTQCRLLDPWSEAV